MSHRWEGLIKWDSLLLLLFTVWYPKQCVIATVAMMTTHYYSNSELPGSFVETWFPMHIGKCLEVHRQGAMSLSCLKHRDLPTLRSRRNFCVASPYNVLLLRLLGECVWESFRLEAWGVLMCRRRICQEYELWCNTNHLQGLWCFFETEFRKEGAQGQERKTELWICVQLRAEAR